jgi:glutaredoxin-like YruB-family protein
MKNVTVYSTPTCPFCKRLKKYLDEKNIEYKDNDVSSDQDALNEMREKSDQMGVPVVDIDGDIIVGFDKENIEEALQE